MQTVNFKLRHLSYFVALANSLNFSEAARRCFVSQPTLSAQIRKLEVTLGVELIERKTAHHMLTPVGQEIAEQARVILHEAQVLEQLAIQARDPFGGALKLGVIPTVAPYLLPCLLAELNKAFPELETCFTEAKTPVLEEQLDDGDLDVAILALPVDATAFMEFFLYREEFYLAAFQSHPLSKNSTVGLEDLQQLELLLLEDGHCFRDQALAVCDQANAVQNMNFSATSVETLKHMVAAGLGLTLIPQTASFDKKHSIAYVPFDPPIHRTIGMVCRRSTTRSSLVEELAEVIKAKAQQMIKAQTH